MENVSIAASIIGIISISFEYAHVRYVELEHREIGPIRLSLSDLVSSIERLCDILQVLKSEPRNAMSPLPAEVELAASACASDLMKAESLVRRVQEESRSSKRRRFAATMVLTQEHVEEMYAILQTHINALGRSAQMSSSAGQPEGSEDTSRVSGRMMEQASSANFIHAMDSPSPDSIRLRDEEARNILARNEQDGISGRVKNAMQRLHDGEGKFSRPQLYQLLCILREIDGFKLDDDDSETDGARKFIDKGDTDYKRFKAQNRECVRRLSNLAETRPTKSRPSEEGRDTIVILKEFISEVTKLSDPQKHNSVSTQGKRKAEAETESQTSRPAIDSRNSKRARRMSVHFALSGVGRKTRRTHGAKQAVLGHVCGRLAEEDGTVPII